MRPRWRTSPTAEALGSDADRARQPDGEHQVTPPSCSSTPADELAIRLRDLRGMTPEFGPLSRTQNMGISSTFTWSDRVRVSRAGSARDRLESRRLFAPNEATKDPDLQGVFYGSDGTRTRDLRRDRPVLVVPG